MEATDNRPSDHLSDGLRRAWHRRLHRQSAVRAVVVVVGNELRQQCLQMPLVEDDDVVQQLPP